MKFQLYIEKISIKSSLSQIKPPVTLLRQLPHISLKKNHKLECVASEDITVKLLDASLMFFCAFSLLKWDFEDAIYKHWRNLEDRQWGLEENEQYCTKKEFSIMKNSIQSYSQESRLSNIQYVFKFKASFM